MSSVWERASSVCYASISYLLGISSAQQFLSNPSTSQASVSSVNISPDHSFTKAPQPSITLLTGLGIEGDAHLGKTTQHMFAKTRTPDAINLRQVHLMESEFLSTLHKEDGSGVIGGELGDNITTQGIKLLELKTGALLEFHDVEEEDEEKESDEFPGVEQEPPRIRVRGLRNPCSLIENHGKGLRAQCLEKDPDTKVITKRKTGVMGTVERGGIIRPGMRIVVVDEGDGELKVV